MIQVEHLPLNPPMTNIRSSNITVAKLLLGLNISAICIQPVHCPGKYFSPDVNLVNPLKPPIAYRVFLKATNDTPDLADIICGMKDH